MVKQAKDNQVKEAKTNSHVTPDKNRLTAETLEKVFQESASVQEKAASIK